MSNLINMLLSLQANIPAKYYQTDKILLIWKYAMIFYFISVWYVGEISHQDSC